MAESDKEDEIKLADDLQHMLDADPVDVEEPGFDPDLAQNTPEEQIVILEAQRDDYRDKFMRALADTENSRKRGERDRREAEKYGGSRLARDMLPVYDNLIRALDAATEEQKKEHGAFFEGVELTLRELLSVFEKHGIEMIVPQIGERFDANLHQAMFEAPLPETKKDEIIQVMANGFLLHDRLLRPAQVGVSSNPAK